MKAFFVSLAGICFINLVPFIITLLMFFTEKSSLSYSMMSIIKSIFSIPTSFLGFALEYDLGYIWWVLVNTLGFVISIILIKKVL